MRILIVTTHLPYPPASGGAIRVHGIVEGLHQAGHDITLMCFHNDTVPINHIQIETVPMPAPRTLSERLRGLLFTHQPDMAKRFYDETFADRLRQLLSQNSYDLIQFEGIEAVCYLPIAKQAQASAKLCFDTFNAEYALQRSFYKVDRQNPKRWLAALYSYLQVGRIKRYEREMCRLADLVIAVSDEDAHLLHVFRDDGQIYVIPNGIRVDHYSHAYAAIPPELQTNSLVFTGKMDYRPNIDAMLWFTEEVAPHIKDKTHLYIVGQQPHPRLDHLRNRYDISITGQVDSVLPYLQAASVYIAPLRMGSGTRLKLLEAMACGCAIVATAAASAGLNQEVKAAMILADTPTTFADAITHLLNNPDERQSRKQQARQLVREYYDWSVLIPKLLDTYRKIGLG